MQSGPRTRPRPSIPYIICIVILSSLSCADGVRWVRETVRALLLRETKIPFFRWRLKHVQHDHFHVSLHLCEYDVVVIIIAIVRGIIHLTFLKNRHTLSVWHPTNTSLIFQSPTKAEQLIRTYSTGESNHSSEEGSGSGNFIESRNRKWPVKSIILSMQRHLSLNKHFRRAKRD